MKKLISAALSTLVCAVAVFCAPAFASDTYVVASVRQQLGTNTNTRSLTSDQVLTEAACTTDKSNGKVVSTCSSKSKKLSKAEFEELALKMQAEHDAFRAVAFQKTGDIGISRSQRYQHSSSSAGKGTSSNSPESPHAQMAY